MNVWITWCKRRAVCKWCSELIVVGKPIVKCVRYKSKDNRMTVRLYFHPQCWLDNGLHYLEENPYTPSQKGRKKLPLSIEDKNQRFILLRRYSALRQRIRNIKSPYPDNALIEARIKTKMAELMEQIIPLGGIPPKWLN